MSHRCESCQKDFETSDALVMHNKAKHPELIPKERKPIPIKKIRNWVIFLVIAGLLVWGLYSLIVGMNEEKTVIDKSKLNFEAPTNAIHWHPILTITIDGKNKIIPTNIGITSNVHYPTHTHDTSGTIHLENNRPTKETVTLGYFFKVWGKRLSKDCIFDYCTDKGELKMYVNGKENFEFENYFMQDNDKIRIEYISKEN